jgi:hypothetical protein
MFEMETGRWIESGSTSRTPWPGKSSEFMERTIVKEMVKEILKF